MAGIYVHVPFCKQKCTYCDFVSFANRESEVEGYFTSLFKEIVMKAPAARVETFQTVYFGGGTPSFVEAVYIAATLKLIKQNYRVAENAEITLEMNPGTVTAEKLATYKRAGINRFSIGFQTADDRELVRLNRIHTKADFTQAATLLQGENYSVDIMIGLHDHTVEQVQESLRVALNYGASHVSMYALTPEDGTPIYTDYLNGELPDGDTVAELYEAGVSYLKSRGFHRYEISNFAKPGMESKHNLNYWKRGEYLGFGLAAHSFYRGKRFSNTENLAEYNACLEKEVYPIVFEETVSPIEAEEEFIMLALRTEKGVSFAEYTEAFQADFTQKYGAKLQKLASFLEIDEKGVRMRPEKMYVQDGVIADLLADL